jgi:hypothetical protein
MLNLARWWETRLPPPPPTATKGGAARRSSRHICVCLQEVWHEKAVAVYWKPKATTYAQ